MRLKGLGLFFVGTRQVIAGIGWELVTSCLSATGQNVPPAATDTGQPFWRRHLAVDRFVFPMLCDERVVAAGVVPLFHSMVAAVAREDDGWAVTLCTKTGLAEYRARVVIDCTADACGAALAGLPLVLTEFPQPATLCCRVSGYDLATLDVESINRAFETEVRFGRLRYTDVSFDRSGPDVGRWLGAAGENANHVLSGDARDSQGRSALELTARRRLLELYRFLRTQPGLERLRFDYLAPECGVRETVTIQGKRRVTLEDYMSGRAWDDAVCHAGYPIDLHTADGRGTDVRLLADNVVPSVPRGALLPAGSHNFLVAGRCISSDRLANSALRVQATAMAVGQAAGAMAALASRTGVDPEALPVDEVHALLIEHGAIVPRC